MKNKPLSPILQGLQEAKDKMTKEKEMEAKALFSRLPPPDQAEASTLFQTSPVLQQPLEGTSDHCAFCSQRPWWRDSHMLTWVPSVAQILRGV